MRKKEVIKQKRPNQLKLASMSVNYSGGSNPPKSRKDREEKAVNIKRLQRMKPIRAKRKPPKS